MESDPTFLFKIYIKEDTKGERPGARLSVPIPEDVNFPIATRHQLVELAMQHSGNTAESNFHYPYRVCLALDAIQALGVHCLYAVGPTNGQYHIILESTEDQKF